MCVFAFREILLISVLCDATPSPHCALSFCGGQRGLRGILAYVRFAAAIRARVGVYSVSHTLSYIPCSLSALVSLSTLSSTPLTTPLRLYASPPSLPLSLSPPC